MKKFEFSQVTTRGGDTGESSLADGERRRKDDLFFHTLGSIDELDAHIGVVRAHLSEAPETVRKKFQRNGADLLQIQNNLRIIGGMTAVPRGSKLFAQSQKIDTMQIALLEKAERLLMEQTKVPQQFVQPGETLISAQMHVARTVCRRAERRVVECIRERGLDHLIPAQRYLNRLSDYLFIAALWYEQNRKE